MQQLLFTSFIKLHACNILWENPTSTYVNQEIAEFCSFFKYSLNTFKCHKSNIKNLWMKSSEIVFIFLPAFYLIIWLMTSPKNFEKIFILKICQLVFFWGVKIYFGKFLLKWCSFRHGKNWFSRIMPFNSNYSHFKLSYFQNGYFIKILWGCHESYNQVKCR